MPPPDGPPPRPGRRMLVRSGLAATLIMLATAGASSTAALLKIDDILPDRRAEDRIRGLPPIRTAEPGAPQTLLLLGSDRRWRDTDDDPPHSDTLMLVRIDPGQEATTVLSLPRDLRVAIPGHGVRKINDAYGLGGPALTLETVQQVTGLEINHIVNVNFRGFRRAIDLFDCFYVDVDRRYFHSNAGVPIGQRYDAIDIEPGYQRLCGVDALDYVRYRHTDSDITRAARQQDFLRAAKDQVSTSAVIDDLERLGEVVGRTTQTDDGLASKAGFLRFAKLALATADAPVRQIRFPARFVEEDDAAYVEASPAAIERVVRRFLSGGGKAARGDADASRRRGEGGRRSAKRRSAGSVRAAGLVEARARGRAAVARLDGRHDTLGVPLRLPSHITERGEYVRRDGIRVYALRDRGGTLHRAYRVVLAENKVDGQFYGVQGTTWRTPPLLANPSEVRRVKGRRLELFRAGERLRFVAWRTDRAAYWISNTLGLKLSNDEMLALAANLTTP